MNTFNFTCIFLFALFISANGRSLSISPSSVPLGDLLDSTCHTCAEMSAIFDYNFCTTSFQSFPGARDANLQELAVIGMELAMRNASGTIGKIEKMMSIQTFDPVTTKCMKSCLNSYAESVSKVVMAMGALTADQPGMAGTFMGSVVEMPMNCEAVFRKKKGQISMFARENYDLFEIGIITLCIINQATPPAVLPSPPPPPPPFWRDVK